MTKKPSHWNLSDMEATLVKDTEDSITKGFSELTNTPVPSAAVSQQPPTAPDEPTKGVQTYVPLSVYRRLSDIKLQRRTTIAALVCEAVTYWLDAHDSNPHPV